MEWRERRLKIKDTMNDIGDRNCFVEELMRVFREQGEDRILSYDAQEFALIIGSPAQLKFNLKRCYEDYCQSTQAKRGDVLSHWAKVVRNSAQAGDDSFEALKPRLRLRIMQHSFATVSPLNASTPAQVPFKTPVCTPLAADLDVCAVSCNEDSVTFLSLGWLNAQQVSIEDTVRCALENRASGREYTVTSHGEVWMHHDPDGFTLAEMLMDKSRRHELHAETSVVALMPEQSILLVAPEDNVTALSQMATIALEIIQHTDYYGSSQPIVLRGDHWEPFTPPTQAMPIFADLHHQLRFAHLEYQGAALQAYFKRCGKKERIARVMSAEKANAAGNYFIALYVPGQTTLVPEVDFLSLVDPGTTRPYFVKWADVLRFAPSHLEQAEWPSFWRVKPTLNGSHLHRYGTFKPSLAASAA